MRDYTHAIRDHLLHVGLALAATCLASACAFDPVAGVPNLLANQDAQCDIGPSWNETPMWDSGEVRLIWRYHKENAWQGVCETSGWGCIHCKWEGQERVCTVDLRIRPRFSQLCHMAVLGHELGHALGKMHDEPRVRVVPVSFIPANTPPATSPDLAPVAAPSWEATRGEEVESVIALEPLAELAPAHLDAMLELVRPTEPVPALGDPADLPSVLPLRLDRTQFDVRAPLPWSASLSPM
ncbi:MAG TPA: hypothetical protein VFP36_05840 [Usitatibacter sp.]|nr:hypothetical protein [Usitatibacter sp.]